MVNNLKFLVLLAFLALPFLSYGQKYELKQLLGSWTVVPDSPTETIRNVWKFETDTVVMLAYRNSTEQQGDKSKATGKLVSSMKAGYKFDGQAIVMKMGTMVNTITIKKLTTARLEGTLNGANNYTEEMAFDKSGE